MSDETASEIMEQEYKVCRERRRSDVRCKIALCYVNKRAFIMLFFADIVTDYFQHPALTSIIKVLQK